MFGGLKKFAAGARGLTGGIDELRDRRVALLDERRTVSRAAPDRDEIMRALHEGLDRSAAAVFEHFYLPRLVAPKAGAAPAFEPATERRPVTDRDLFGLLHLADGDGLRTALERYVDARLEGRKGMSREEQARRLAEIDAQIFEIELHEEGAIRAAEEAGISILRRRDADPRAFLAADAALPAQE